jgi:hypothetical protein
MCKPHLIQVRWCQIELGLGVCKLGLHCTQRLEIRIRNKYGSMDTYMFLLKKWVFKSQSYRWYVALPT